MSEEKTQANEKLTAKRYEISNFADEDGMPILVNAIMRNNIRSVGLLLISGANPNAKDKLGCSVIEHACMNGEPCAVAMLVRFGASYDFLATNGEKMSLLVDHILGDGQDFVITKRGRFRGDENDFDDYDFMPMGGMGGMSGMMRGGKRLGGFEMGLAMGDPEEKRMTAALFRGRPPRIFEELLSSQKKISHSHRTKTGGDQIKDEDENSTNNGFYNEDSDKEENDKNNNSNTNETSKNDKKKKRETIIPFEEESIPITKPLQEVQKELQDYCCTGDERGVLEILKIPHIPLWIKNIEAEGAEAISLRPQYSSFKSSIHQHSSFPISSSSSSSSSTTPFPSTTSSSSSTSTTQPSFPQTSSSSPFPSTSSSSPFIQTSSSPFPSTSNEPTRKDSLLAQKKDSLLALRAAKKKSTLSFASEDDSNLSDDGSGYEFETEETKNAANKVPSVPRTTVEPNSIDQMIQEQCDEIAIFFESFTPEIAEMVLRHFSWNLDLEKIGELMDKGYDENKFKEVAGVLRSKKSEKLKIPDSCDICTSETSADEILSLGCQHFACRECWKTYLDSRVTGLAAECLFAPCIGHNKYSQCGLLVPESFFQLHSSPASFKLYKNLREHDYVRNCKKGVMAYCPGPDCGRIAVVREMTEDDVIAQCVQIRCFCPIKLFCLGCVKIGNDHKTVQAHPPATCQNIADWTKKITEEARYFTFRVKHCPSKDCRAPIVKCGCGAKVICNDMDHCPNQACNHMTCKSCKTEFCWLCGEFWKRHSSYYSCNKQLQEKAPTEFFKGCLERYDDHMKSLKSVTEREELSKVMFQFFRSKYPIIFQHDTFSEINNDLMKSYRVLAYSYVRRFYIQFEHDGQRNLYEMQQGMLENHNNQLIGMYEDFKKRFEVELIDEEESVLRQQLIQMHEYKLLLQGFRKNLVDSFSSWASEEKKN